MKKIILAIDSFKGCMTSEEVENAIASSLNSKEIEIHKTPMSDGGEGMLEAFISALNGKIIETNVHDPLMRPITAQYGITPDGTAVIETAKACGLTLMTPEERNPMKATTYGVGELIIHALHSGCRNFIIGLGGSGTSDCGKGMLKAVSDSFTDKKNIKDIIKNEMKNCRFTLASDVRNPLYGPEGAARIFAPQKGATPQQVEQLDEAMRYWAGFIRQHYAVDLQQMAGSGAAGGLGGGVLPYLNAKLQSGIEIVLDMLRFRETIHDADLILTGEGKLDKQTGMGKALGGILRYAQEASVPVLAIGGCVEDCETLNEMGFAGVFSIQSSPVTLEQALQPDFALENIRRVVTQIMRTIKVGIDG